MHSCADNDPSPRNGASEPEATAFTHLGLHPILNAGLLAAGRDTLTPVQARAIPPALRGRDVLACAGQDDSVAEALVLPVLHHLLADRDEAKSAGRRVRALLLAPTVAAAEQIAATVARYSGNTGLKRLAAVGSLPEHGLASLRKEGVDLLVSTPKGVLELLHQGDLELSAVERLVLTNFDEMLEAKCLAAVGRVIHHLPAQRQTLLFCGALPAQAKELVGQILRDPVHALVHELSVVDERVEHWMVGVEPEGKRAALVSLLRDASLTGLLVLTRTKHSAVASAKFLLAAGHEAVVLHGGQSDDARLEALEQFRGGTARVLVSTDAALRGCQVVGVSHLVNYDLPSNAQTYVARLTHITPGSAPNTVTSFCSRGDRGTIANVERALGRRIPALGSDTSAVDESEAPPPPRPRRRSPRTTRSQST